MSKNPKQNERTLLATMTEEPFQPVRLYYAIPARQAVIRKLRDIECTIEEPLDGCWQWLFHAEAASLGFGAGKHGYVPRERRPFILGRLRFPQSGSMTLETNSIERAIQGARFFGPRLGPDVVALRCRVVNRFFAADECEPNELMKTLDLDASVADPRQVEADVEQLFKGARSAKDADRLAAERIERRLKSGEDVPLVEDFPLAPEEETADFQHLATGLQFRLVRAFEHWRGNTHLTLAAIIERTVRLGMRAHGGPPGQPGDRRTKETDV